MAKYRAMVPLIGGESPSDSRLDAGGALAGRSSASRSIPQLPLANEVARRGREVSCGPAGRREPGKSGQVLARSLVTTVSLTSMTSGVDDVGGKHWGSGGDEVDAVLTYVLAYPDGVLTRRVTRRDTS
jgi:hypothetical protein